MQIYRKQIKIFPNSVTDKYHEGLFVQLCSQPLHVLLVVIGALFTSWWRGRKLIARAINLTFISNKSSWTTNLFSVVRGGL